MYLPTRRAVGMASLFYLLGGPVVFSTFSDSFPIIVAAQDKTPPQTPDNAAEDGRHSCQARQSPARKPPEIDGPVIVNTDLITLTVTVTDTYGRYVSGLGQGRLYRVR